MKRLTCLGCGLLLLTGCQTWVGGMTLPTGHYFKHPPQYIPPSPAFTLPRELANMQASDAAAPAGTSAPVPPPPVPVPPGP